MERHAAAELFFILGIFRHQSQTFYQRCPVLGLLHCAIIDRIRLFLHWLLLDLLANLVAHATIWSIAMAATFAVQECRRDRTFIAGAVVYLVLLAFGIDTMIPAADYGPWGADPGPNFKRLSAAGLTVRLKKEAAPMFAAECAETMYWFAANAAYYAQSVCWSPRRGV